MDSSLQFTNSFFNLIEETPPRDWIEARLSSRSSTSRARAPRPRNEEERRCTAGCGETTAARDQLRARGIRLAPRLAPRVEGARRRRTSTLAESSDAGRRSPRAAPTARSTRSLADRRTPQPRRAAATRRRRGLRGLALRVVPRPGAGAGAPAAAAHAPPEPLKMDALRTMDSLGWMICSGG